MKNSFPEQTRDSVELLYHKEILEEFDLYGEFWEKFIGVRLDKERNPKRELSTATWS